MKLCWVSVNEGVRQEADGALFLPGTFVKPIISRSAMMMPLMRFYLKFFDAVKNNRKNLISFNLYNSIHYCSLQSLLHLIL